MGISLYSIAPQMHTSLMSHLKLGDDVKGLFTPLIAQASKSAQNRLGKSKAMVGCHIKLEGEGVQWLGGEVRGLRIYVVITQIAAHDTFLVTGLLCHLSLDPTTRHVLLGYM